MAAPHIDRSFTIFSCHPTPETPDLRAAAIVTALLKQAHETNERNEQVNHGNETTSIREGGVSMYRKTVSLLLLSLLCGCVDDTAYLIGAAPADSRIETSSLRASEPTYTSHPAHEVKAEIVPLSIIGPFTLYERAKIVRAVNEWNVALNGFIRFEIVTDDKDVTSQATVHWMITSAHGGQNLDVASALAATYPVVNAGGLMVIYVDRIGRRDLGGVVMHELGHVLGLGHDANGHLMAARYHPSSQQCVDKAAVQALAAKRHLPLAELNWCEASAAR
jgi:hypothetical protein